MRGASPPDASGVFAFVFFVLSFFVGRAQRLPPNALGVFACVVFFRQFCLLLLLLLVFFLRDVLGSNVAVRGGNLKENKAGGGLGGRAQRLCVVFFRQFCLLLLLVIFLRDVLGSNVAMRGGNLKQKKGWRGVGGEGAAPPPQMHWVSLHVLFFFVSFVFFFFFL